MLDLSAYRWTLINARKEKKTQRKKKSKQIPFHITSVEILRRRIQSARSFSSTCVREWTQYETRGRVLQKSVYRIPGTFSTWRPRVRSAKIRTEERVTRGISGSPTTRSCACTCTHRARYSYACNPCPLSFRPLAIKPIFFSLKRACDSALFLPEKTIPTRICPVPSPSTHLREIYYIQSNSWGVRIILIIYYPSFCDGWISY